MHPGPKTLRRPLTANFGRYATSLRLKSCSRPGFGSGNLFLWRSQIGITRSRALSSRAKGGRQRLAIMTGDRSVQILKTYIDQRSTKEFGHRALLANARSGALGSQGVARILSQLAKRAGIGKLTPHMMRNTVATLLLRTEPTFE